MHACMCVCMYIHTTIYNNHACIITYTHIHACMHPYMHACMHACIHAYIHPSIHTYIHHIHTNTHKFTHTQLLSDFTVSRYCVTMELKLRPRCTRSRSIRLRIRRSASTSTYIRKSICSRSACMLYIHKPICHIFGGLSARAASGRM